jgi:hypothetical protein
MPEAADMVDQPLMVCELQFNRKSLNSAVGELNRVL